MDYFRLDTCQKIGDERFPRWVIRDGLGSGGRVRNGVGEKSHPRRCCSTARSTRWKQGTAAVLAATRRTPSA